MRKITQAVKRGMNKKKNTRITVKAIGSTLGEMMKGGKVGRMKNTKGRKGNKGERISNKEEKISNKGDKNNRDKNTNEKGAEAEAGAGTKRTVKNRLAIDLINIYRIYGFNFRNHLHWP